MTEQEENFLLETLREAVRSGKSVLWNPDPSIAKPILSIGELLDEPSKCAYFSKGEYVALYNCPLSDFVVATRLKSPYGSR